MIIRIGIVIVALLSLGGCRKPCSAGSADQLIAAPKQPTATCPDEERSVPQQAASQPGTGIFRGQAIIKGLRFSVEGRISGEELLCRLTVKNVGQKEWVVSRMPKLSGAYPWNSLSDTFAGFGVRDPLMDVEQRRGDEAAYFVALDRGDAYSTTFEIPWPTDKKYEFCDVTMEYGGPLSMYSLFKGIVEIKLRKE